MEESEFQELKDRISELYGGINHIRADMGEVKTSVAVLEAAAHTPLSCPIKGEVTQHMGDVEKNVCARIESHERQHAAYDNWKHGNIYRVFGWLGVAVAVVTLVSGIFFGVYKVASSDSTADADNTRIERTIDDN